MRSLCLLVLVSSCATAPTTAPLDAHALHHLQLTEKGSDLEGGRVIFVSNGRLILQIIPAGLPAMRRHVLPLDATALKELDALAVELIDAVEPQHDQVPLSVDAPSVALDIAMSSRRKRSLFSPNHDYVWFGAMRNWLVEHGKLAELQPAVHSGAYDPDWRPDGWLQ